MVILSGNAKTSENVDRGSLSSIVLRGAASLSASQVVRRAVRILFLLLAARSLGPEIFGIYILILTITEFVALVSGGGFADYLTREVSKSPHLAYQRWLQITFLRFGYLLLFAPLGVLVLRLLKYPSSVFISAALLSLTLFPRAVVESSQGIMRAMNRFGAVLWVESIQGTTLLGTGVILLVKGITLRGIIWAELISISVATFVALPIAVRLCLRRKAVWSNWKERIRETFAFNLYPLIGNTYDRVDVILLAKMIGSAAAGIYSLPYRAYATLSILPWGIMSASLPSLAKSNWDQDERKRCITTMQLLYAAALFVILCIMLLANDLVRIVLGASYIDSATVLKILSWATIPMFLNYALNTFLLAKRHEKVFLRTASVCLVANVAANILLIPRYSYFAAAGVTVFTELVLFSQNLFLTHKLLGYVPMPALALRNSIVFAMIIGVALGMARFLPTLIVAGGALIIFAAHLLTAHRAFWHASHEDTVCTA
jgi:O-antigen/teichoic acid export membrane protein